MTRPIKGAMERRTVLVSELRAGDSQGDEMALVGRAASFNNLSQDLGGFREVLAPGCFKRSLASGADVHCLFNHDPNQVLGRLKNKTLTVEEDNLGLKFRCLLNPASQSHRDIYAAIKRDDINQCSFAFRCDEGDDDWTEDKDERGMRFTKRTIRNLNLMDVSAVTYPAYDKGTMVMARSMPNYGAPEFLAYAQKRAKQLGIIISMDATTMRAWAQVDALNRAEALRIGRQIESDAYAIEHAQNADDDLRRKMELAAGRLRK